MTKTIRRKLVLVTGASGFIGAHVVEHLLEAGYGVRGICRSPKAALLRKLNIHPHFEVVVVDDIVNGDFTLALTNVHGIIHVASPLLHSNNYLEVAKDGTMNLLRQAHANGIYKITIISSFGATFTSASELLDPAHTVTDKDWNKLRIKDVLQPGTSLFDIYITSKTLAERSAWAFAKSHPKMDLVTILPTYVYGPVAPTQVATDPENTLSTNGWIYMLVSGQDAPYPDPILPHAVDVRDVAKAAVLSLKTSRVHRGEKKRILLWGGSFTWKQAIRHLADVRPELKHRLLDGGDPPHEEEVLFSSIDTSNAKRYLGLAEFVGWQRMIEDAVDSLLKKEMTWEVANRRNLLHQK